MEKAKNKADSTVAGANRQAFAKRVETLVEEAGNVSKLARMAGVAESTVRKWKSGTSDPSREDLIKLGSAANVLMDWLVLGLGPMRAGAAPAAQVSPGEAVGSDVSAALGGDEDAQRRIARARGDVLTRYRQVQEDYRGATEAVGYEPNQLVADALKQCMMAHGLDVDGLVLVLQMMKAVELEE